MLKLVEEERLVLEELIEVVEIKGGGTMLVVTAVEFPVPCSRTGRLTTKLAKAAAKRADEICMLSNET